MRFGALGFSMFWGAVIFFVGRGQKSDLGGVGKNAAKVMRGLWSGTMMMGASWEIFILHADTPARDCQWDPKIKQ